MFFRTSTPAAGLRNGVIAGIVVGSVVGALVLLVPMSSFVGRYVYVARPRHDGLDDESSAHESLVTIEVSH